MPKVAIIILNWNGLADTVECLESLKMLTYPDYEVIVVDNGSAGTDADTLAAKYGDYIHLIRNDKNYGFVEGNNIGIRHVMASSRPDHILLLNNDTAVDPGFLTALVEAAETDPRIGIAGPKVYSYHRPDRLQSAGGMINWWTGNLRLIGWGHEDADRFNQSADVDWVFGCALMIRTTVIQDIGLMYPGYFALAEETDWCARCKKAGYRVIYVPAARIRHKGGQSFSGTSASRLYYIGRNRFLFMKRNASTLQLAVFVPQFLLRNVPLMVMTILLRRRSPGLLAPYFKGVAHGLQLIWKGS